MSDVVSPVLVGRQEELARLRAAVARTVAGEPGVVLVGGEAGVGKSRLLETALDDAPQVRVLTGGCVELGGEGLPFVPLVDALRTLTRTTPPDQLDRLLGPARTELARLLPELAPAGATPAPDSGSTAQLFELVLGVLGRLGAERTLVLVVEDLHWADRSTLDLVAFLVRTLQGIRVLLVLTYRSDEVDRRSPLRPLLSTWERLRGVERLHLDRLGRADVAAQVGAILGAAPEPPLLDVVFDRSEGNPFFVEELLRTLREGASEHELPPSLRDVLLARAERLSPAAQRLLRTAAVAGRWVPERLLADVADVPATDFYGALREAVDSSLLSVDGSGRGYAFRHALTRDAVYQDLLPGERVDLHTAYAQALDRDPGLAGDDASVTATLAVHWYAAHDLPRALAASVRAGREAAAAFAPAEARTHLERALEVWRGVPEPETWAAADKVEVLLMAARASFDSGDPQRAIPLLQQAQALVDPAAEPERMAELVAQRAYTWRALGRDSASLESLKEALATVPEHPPTLVRATLLASLANALMRLGDEHAGEVAGTALEAARAVGAPAEEAGALITLGAARTNLGESVEGEAALREGLRVALDHSDQTQALRGYVNLSDALEGHGKHQEAVEVARAGTELSRQVGQYRTYGVYLVGNQAESLVRLGEWAEAERLLREGLSSGVSGVFAATLEDLLSYLAVHKGAGEEALAHVGQARRHLGDTAEPQFTHSLAFVEADVARARGDLQAAAGVATAGLSDTTFWSARYGWPLVWLVARIDADLATLARDRNTTPPDPVTARLRLPTAASGSSPATAGFQAMAAAEELRRAGRPGVAGWEETVQAWEVAGHAWALAYARYRLAEALCADGRRVEAVAPLRAAAASAAHLGAAPLQDDVMALARRARLSLADEETAPEAATEASTEASTSFGLTEREREVLGLVSAGRSNGQIASALFISPKTASVHVSNILAKLGVSGRVEAAGVAHRLGLVQLPPV